MDSANLDSNPVQCILRVNWSCDEAGLGLGTATHFTTSMIPLHSNSLRK